VVVFHEGAPPSIRRGQSPLELKRSVLSRGKKKGKALLRKRTEHFETGWRGFVARRDFGLKGFAVVGKGRREEK